MFQLLRNERKSFLIYVLILTLCTESFQYCNIHFPNPTEQFSKKFILSTNQGSEKFTNVASYIPGKTYDITVTANNKHARNKWSMEEVYVQINRVPIDSDGVQDNEYRNVGKLTYNFTGGSRLEQCGERLHVKFFYNLPEETTFYWTAPVDTNGCITMSVIVKLKSHTSDTVLEEKTHAVCDPKVSQQDTMQADQPQPYNCALKMKPDPTKMCNIKSTAIYRMIIENNWNHLNHWKDWPGREGYVPKLTQYLGASHSINFDIYHLGGMAIPAVQELCTNGSYKSLQKKFYDSGNDILTVILARSLEATPVSSKRSALIVVNATYHLITFLSHLVPSPDWCTGLSRFDICSGKCSWPEKVTVSLYPWDAGVYSGESYLSSKDIENSSPICPITNTWPKDNPFTKIKGKLQNIGTVTFKLIQEYNKDQNLDCNPNIIELHDQADIPETPKKPKSTDDGIRHCQLSEWSEWSSCSKTCGNGEKVRYRKILKGKPDKCNNLKLKDVENCYHKCPRQLTIDNCLLRLWTEWSQCNATCSQSGLIYRDRVFIDEEERKQCSIYPEMRQVETCIISDSRCDPATVCNEYLNTGELCEWLNPTLRYYFDQIGGTCKSFTFKGCHGGLNNFIHKHECESMCGKYSKKLSQYRTRQPDDNDYKCNTPVSWGQDCRGKSPSYLWYFDNINQGCYQFYFAGCRGSANRFKTKKECQETCLTKTQSTVQFTTVHQQLCMYSQWSDWSSCSESCPQTRTRTRSLDSPAVNCNGELTQIEKCDTAACNPTNLKPETLEMCKYSPWSAWSTCSVLCGKGIRERVRIKINHNCIPEFPQFSHRETCYNDCRMY